MQRRNTIVTGFGRKGSGKSQFLHDWFTSRAPRVLSLDGTGETVERNPLAVECIGFGALMDALNRAADFGRWHIAAAIEPADVRELFRLLTPPLGTGDSLSKAFGGMAVECGEVDLIAPNGSTPDEVESALRRGRHYALDLYLATQRPASCSRDVSAQADIIFAFAQGEPRDLDFIARTISEPVARRVATLPRYHCIYHTRDDGAVYELDADRRVVASLSTMTGEAQGLTMT